MVDTLEVDTFEPDPLILDSISVRHFRSLYDLGPISLQSGLTVIAGQNDGGKSAFLDSLSFLLDKKSVDKDDRWTSCQESDEIVVQGTFYHLSDTKRETPFKVRARQCPPSNKVLETAELVHNVIGANVSAMSVASLKECMSNNDIAYLSGDLKADLVAKVKHWISARPIGEFSETWRTSTAKEIARLPTLLLFSTQSNLDPEIAIQNVVRAQSKVLLQDNEFRGPLVEIQSRLDAKLQTRTKHLEEHIKRHCRDIDQVAITAQYAFDSVSPTTSVAITQSGQGGAAGQTVSINKMGDGRRRRVNLAVYEASMEVLRAPETFQNSYIVVYDEPDTHMDYAAQRRLFSTLQSQSEISGVQVVVTTHSKNFIDSVQLDQIVNFKLDNQFKTVVSRLSSSTDQAERAFQGDIYLGLGFRNSILLDDRCFLVVEGPTEQYALPLLYQNHAGKSMAASGVHVVHSGGEGAMDVFLQRLKNEWQRRVFMLLDMDIRTPKRLNAINNIGLLENKEAFFIGITEFEDAFCDDIWVYALSRFHPVDVGQSDWVAGDVTTLRNSFKFSDSLLSLVNTKSKVRGFTTKPHLGISVANACIELQHLPPVLDHLFTELLSVNADIL